MRRLSLIVVSTIVAALATAPSAFAGIWTLTPSGTSQDISAVDYRGPGDILYATAGGQILRNGTIQGSFAGVQFTDIALNPAGDRGLATGATGKLYRYTGVSWVPVGLANTTYGHTCGGVGPFARNTTPTGNLNAVTWAGANTAYVVGTDRGVVLRTTDGGLTFIDVSRQSDGGCKADQGSSDAFTDIQAVTDQLIYLINTNFGARRITTDAFASLTIPRNTSSVNCPGQPSKIAIDLESPNRSWVTGGCPGQLSFGFSSDSGDIYDLGHDYINGSSSELTGMRDVSAAGGSAVAVGNSGVILISLDGRNAYFQRADGVEAGTDWLAVDKRSAGDAAVGGRGGKLVVSNQANAIPDVVKPAGTITGPAQVSAGRPATFTANVADNVGGSGINPASFAWSATGVPAATGNPAALTFPSAGFYTLRVTFADNAGNTGEATLGVTVGAAVPPSLPPIPVDPVKTTTVKVLGGTLALGAPRACIPAGSTFSARLSFKKSTKKITNNGKVVVKITRVVFTINGKQKKTDKKAPFSQRMTVKNLKAGTKHTLRARATMKVRRGKGPTKSITTKITVCG